MKNRYEVEEVLPPLDDAGELRDVVNGEGDIVHIDDCYDREAYVYDLDSVIKKVIVKLNTDLESKDVATIRECGNFDLRNKALVKAMSELALYARSQGASKMGEAAEDGRPIAGAHSAETRSRKELASARKLGKEACWRCPLKRNCGIYQEGINIVDKVKNSSNTGKLRDRLRKRSESTRPNNHFCETTLGNDRLKKHIP